MGSGSQESLKTLYQLLVKKRLLNKVSRGVGRPIHNQQALCHAKSYPY